MSNFGAGDSHAVNFGIHRYHPVIELPKNYEVYDFTENYDPDRERKSPFGIGKYNEKRAGMYTTELFNGKGAAGGRQAPRDIHVGIDIAAPVGTPVHAFFDGEIFLFGNNAAAGDYGYTLITLHLIDAQSVWALHGHLSKKSVDGKREKTKFKAGDVIAWVGDKNENGGWNPHLHFQLSLVEPKVPDLPGVVNEKDREAALKMFPDPRLVLGPLY